MWIRSLLPCRIQAPTGLGSAAPPAVSTSPVADHDMATTEHRSPSLRFRLEPDGVEVTCAPEIVIVAGFTGRDRAAVDEHLAELEQLGVAPPPSVPAFYPVPPQLVTQDHRLVTIEQATSGEAEASLIVHDGEVFVAVGSDHTDRAAERIDIPLSKRACEKLLGRALWRLGDVADRWDELRLRSWIGDDASQLYQDGVLGSLLPPNEVLGSIPWEREPRCFVVLCGTVATIGGVRPSRRFRAELLDPLTERSLALDYSVETIDLLRSTAR
jgi:hypothetical protein